MIAPVLACAALLTAEAPPPGSTPRWTEARVAQRAVEASAAVKALERRVEEGLAGERAEAAWENPELRLRGHRSDLDFEGGQIALRWSPPRPGERTARRAAAAQRTAGFSAEREISRRDVSATARALHAMLLGLDAQLAVAREERAERERTRVAVQQRLEAAAATVLERGDVELARLEVDAQVRELEIRRAGAEDELRRLLDLPAGAAVALSAEGATQCAAPDVSAPGSVAGDDPRLEVLRSGAREAEAELLRDRLALLPWPSYVQAAWVVPRRGDPGYWSFQVGVELPLFDLGRAARQADSAKRAAVGEELRAEVRAGAVELQRARSELDARAVQAEHHRASARALEEALRPFARHAELEGSLAAGQLRARLLAARRAALEAELKCVLARVAVDRLAGV